MTTSSRLRQIIGLFAEYSLFYWALLQKRPIILKSLLIVAAPYDEEDEGIRDKQGRGRCDLDMRFQSVGSLK